MKSRNKRRRHSLFFRILKSIVRLFRKKPRIINKNDCIQQQAIMVSNHSAISGPVVMTLFFPSFFVPWGAYPMTKNYRSRFHYLYRVTYRRKLGYNRMKALVFSIALALFSKMVYRGVSLIPTYPDLRLIKTFKDSAKCILDHKPVMIFPEDSSEGYHDYLDRFDAGFVVFAKYFYKKYNIDLPVYSVYFDRETNTIMIDQPRYILPMIEQGMSVEAIADYFKDITNGLREELTHKVQQD